MEDASGVRSYLAKTPWYRRTWGELLLVVLLIASLLVLFFFSAVAREVVKIRNTQTVDDVTGSGSLSLTASAAPVADTSKVQLLENANMALGSEDATLTIVEFADFGCPFSEDASHTIRELAAKYPTRFRYIYHDFPIVELHPDAENAALAGRCAAAKGKFWAYHDKLYANQGAHDQLSLVRYAAEIGLDVEDFAVCLGSKKYLSDVRKDMEAASQEGVRGTPTFFLNGHKAEGPLPKDKLEALLLKFPEV